MHFNFSVPLPHHGCQTNFLQQPVNGNHFRTFGAALATGQPIRTDGFHRGTSAPSPISPRFGISVSTPHWVEAFNQQYTQKTGRTLSPPFQTFLHEMAEGPNAFERALYNPHHFPTVEPGTTLRVVAEGSSRFGAEFLAPAFLQEGILLEAMSPEQLATRLGGEKKLGHFLGSSRNKPHHALISQSGTTSSLTQLLEEYPHIAHVTVLTNSPNATLHQKYPDQTMVLNAGDETSIPATKSVMATIGAMANWATQLGADMNQFTYTPEYLRQLLKAPLQGQLIDWAMDIAQQQKAASHPQTPIANTVFLGTESYMPLLKELHLKLRETARISLEADSLEHFHHGPKAVLGQTPNLVVVFPMEQKGQPNLQEKTLAHLQSYLDTYQTITGESFPRNQLFILFPNTTAIQTPMAQHIKETLGLPENRLLTLPAPPSELTYQVGCLYAMQLFAAAMTDQNGLSINNPFLVKSVKHPSKAPV